MNEFEVLPDSRWNTESHMLVICLEYQMFYLKVEPELLLFNGAVGPN